MKASTLFLISLALLGGCSGEPTEAQLRPPKEWRGIIAANASSAGASLDLAARQAAKRASNGHANPQVVGPAVAAAIRFSRNQALGAGTRPIPPAVQAVLSPYFPAPLLKRVRWTLAGQRISLGSLLAGWYYQEGAVTLQDVVVFSDRHVAENVWLWAHELAHVQQYEALGVDGFAHRYVTDWRGVEAAATEVAHSVTAKIRAARESVADPARQAVGALGKAPVEASTSEGNRGLPVGSPEQ